MQKVYGYIQNYNGEFIETGFSEKGAKVAATRRDEQINGYKTLVVGYRSPINNMFVETSKKVCGKWYKS